MHIKFFERVLNHLSLNYNSVLCNSLYFGKMGGAIFYYHYYKKTRKRYYEDYAGMLLDSIITNYKHNSEIRFADGLCGIGWGIEYLLQNKMILGDSDDILENIDKKVMEINLCRLTDFSLDSGLNGILQYCIARLTSKERHWGRNPFNRDYMDELKWIVEQPNIPIYPSLRRKFEMYFSKPYVMTAIIPHNILVEPINIKDNFPNIPIGIYKGLTSYALNTLLR
ncbi:MAG: lanthionine synthetase LanC family protein [Monoglobus pectinilyticus]